MKVRCLLRDIRKRQRLSIKQVSETSGVNRGVLSMIERGRHLPSDEQVGALERAYRAAKHEWWPAEVLVVLELDDEEET